MSESEAGVGVKICFWLSIVAGVYIVIFHIAAFVLESFLANSNAGRALFNGGQELPAIAITFAKNQGVYNLVLAALMFWALVLARFDRADSRPLRFAFHLSVAVVGIAGGITVSGLVALVQATPGIIGALATLLETFLLRRNRSVTKH